MSGGFVIGDFSEYEDLNRVWPQAITPKLLSYSVKDLRPAEESSIPSPPSEYEKESIDVWPLLDIVSYDFGLSSDIVSYDFGPDGHFPPKFKRYMKDELKWSRLAFSGKPHNYNYLVFVEIANRKAVDGFSGVDKTKIVFPLMANNFMDLIPKLCASPQVRVNIRHALKEMILNAILGSSLVQFWAPVITLRGRILLTTQLQPFALGKTHNNIDRQRLCDYRMMCREYKFNTDAERGEDQLGLPGRVFLHRFPESTPDVKYYSKNEYPQLDDAIKCFIKGSWALPVFDSGTCVGVLEIASLLNLPSVWHEKSFLGHLCDIFQELGLQIFDGTFDGYRHCDIQSRYKNEASTAAFQELEMVCQSVCKIHNLPLALTWASCNSCNDLLRSQYQFGDQDYFDYSNLLDFMEVSTECYLRKRVVTERMATAPNLLYCSDVQQFNITEYPLVSYVRRCKLSGWFTMCLRSSYTVNGFYVLEFFLPTSSKWNENVMTTISLILGTMEGNFRTFKLTSGQELGEELSVEVLDFQNVQKSRSVQRIRATRHSPSLETLKVEGVALELGQLDQSSMDAINNGMNVLSEAQTDNLPSLEPLQNGEVAMQLDSSDQQSMGPSNNGATRCIPTHLKVGGAVLQLGQLDQSSMDAINNGMNVVSEAQTNNLPSLELLQNGEVAMQLDSSDHQSMDLSNNGQNVGTMEQNIIVVSSPEEGTRKTQEKDHKKVGVRIEVSFEDILKCSKMSCNKAARKLQVSRSRLKRICRWYGIYCWPPRKIKMVRKICRGYGIYRWLPHEINMFRKVNMVCYSRPLPVEDQEQIPKLPSDLLSDQASASVGNIKPGLQDASMVTIKAKYENYTLKFKLPLLSRLEDLRQEVAKRLKNLGAETYYVQYKDEDDELILIACNEDLEDCINSSRSLGNSTIVVLLEPRNQLPT